MLQVTSRARETVEKLAAQHWERLYRIAYNVLRNTQQAEEAVQEALLKAMRYISKREDRLDWLPEASGPLPRATLSWMSTVVRNKAIDVLRKNRRRSNAMTKLREDCEGASQPAAVGRSLDIRRALRTLSPNYEMVVMLHVFEGMTFREVAETLEAKESTVSMRYYRALKKLKKALGEE